jgi:hypothetical protein
VPGVWVEERGGGVADHRPASQCSGCCLGPLPVAVASKLYLESMRLVPLQPHVLT